MNKNFFYLALFSLMPVAYFMYQPIQLGDLAIWTALGRDSLAAQKIIRFDSYTVTQTREMVYPWLLCLFYGWMDSLGGLELVGLFHKMIPFFWASLWYLGLRTKNFSWHLGILIVFYISLVGTTLILIERPALVATLTFLSALLIILQARGRQLRNKEIICLLAIQIIWVNIHGSFLIAPLLLGWSSLDNLYHHQSKAFFQRFTLSSVLVVISLLNPFGWKVFPYILETARLSAARRIDEWAPPHVFAYPFASWFFYLCSAGVAIFFWRLLRKKQISWTDFIFHPFFPIWMTGFFAIRNTGFFFLALPLVLGVYLKKPAPEVNYKTPAMARWLNAGVILALLLVIISFNPFLKSNNALFLPKDKRVLFAVKSTLPLTSGYLAAHEGTILNDWLYGSSLAYFQKNKFYIDTRNVIFTDETENNYETFMYQLPGADQWFARQDFSFVLVDQKHHPKAAQYMTQNPDWAPVLREDDAILFHRKSRP